jgi:hypothetical protein
MACIEFLVKLVGTLAIRLVICEYGSVVELGAAEMPVGEADCSTGLACTNSWLWIEMAQAVKKRARNCSFILKLLKVFLRWRS